MPFTNGQSGNPNGRPRGAGNKASNELRGFLGIFLEGNKGDIDEAWKKLTPMQKLTIWKDLLRFVLPTMQSVEMQSDFDRMSNEELNYILEELKREMRENLNNERE